VKFVSNNSVFSKSEQFATMLWRVQVPIIFSLSKNSSDSHFNLKNAKEHLLEIYFKAQQLALLMNRKFGGLVTRLLRQAKSQRLSECVSKRLFNFLTAIARPDLTLWPTSSQFRQFVVLVDPALFHCAGNHTVDRC
jgi:hypothetical protein